MSENVAFKPDWISAPGETILDILEERALPQTEFAEQIGYSPSQLDDLLQGHGEIAPQLASRISRVLGGTDQFWINRERQYREALARQTQEWLKMVPLKDMGRFGWLDQDIPRQDTAAVCLRFFGVRDVAAWHLKYSALVESTAFRTSPTFSSEKGAVAAWLRKGEIEAQSLDCRPWSPARFREVLLRIRSLTRKRKPDVFLPELVDLCAQCGVAVVIVRAPAGCRASGATRFLSEGKALLLLSFRYLSDDHFWFTFFHEAGHLLLHGKDALFIEGLRVTNAQETEANEFSANILIPPEFKPLFANLALERHAIRGFARTIGVAPGIVVGQLQHSRRARPNQLNNLKARFQWGNRD